MTDGKPIGRITDGKPIEFEWEDIPEWMKPKGYEVAWGVDLTWEIEVG